MKMKFIWAAAIAAMAFTSCANDDAKGGTEGDGKPTMVQISVTQNVSKTRANPGATTDREGKATDSEKNIMNGKIYVFNSSRIFEKVVDLSLDSDNKWSAVF